MNTTSTQQSSAPATDPDLSDQALPGHGIPSQDPDPNAQRQLDPEEAARESQSVLMGGGLVAGMATGAAIGVAVAGPVGVLVGASLGAVAGALGGASAGAGAATEASAAAVPPLQAPDRVTRPVSSAGATAVRLHIEDSGGSGRPLVLIHGWPLSAQAWSPQVSVLRDAGYRVVAYDRRGFGRSDKPDFGYSYDILADDLQGVMDQCALQDVTLVGFSMGGGEVARYIGRHGESRLRRVVFAASVTPCLLNASDNPEGPLTREQAQETQRAFLEDRGAFFERFVRNFYSAGAVVRATEAQRMEAIGLCQQSAHHAALACMEAFQTTDFRADLAAVTVPTLVIHGEADQIVPIEGSGQRTHRAVAHSQMVRIGGAPHGLNLSHASAFNETLLSFLRA
ncbi:alpha/beta fold hydrolase [Kinneretia aquatilis]|uniref:alpha/beta fold hydrolase n=1 Tax=Kinneretia aquatilis TaxID=2070761 RepID=UPI001CC14255|nr:alpha/beta hydrolase [Paucibacter aquatile]WIV97268.1 alpha/beta hydrolase [Paucibacter aquatile]